MLEIFLPEFPDLLAWGPVFYNRTYVGFAFYQEDEGFRLHEGQVNHDAVKGIVGLRFSSLKDLRGAIETQLALLGDKPLKWGNSR